MLVVVDVVMEVTVEVVVVVVVMVMGVMAMVAASHPFTWPDPMKAYNILLKVLVLP